MQTQARHRPPCPHVAPGSGAARTQAVRATVLTTSPPSPHPPIPGTRGWGLPRAGHPDSSPGLCVTCGVRLVPGCRELRSHQPWNTGVTGRQRDGETEAHRAHVTCPKSHRDSGQASTLPGAGGSRCYVSLTGGAHNSPLSASLVRCPCSPQSQSLGLPGTSRVCRTCVGLKMEALGGERTA